MNRSFLGIAGLAVGIAVQIGLVAATEPNHDWVLITERLETDPLFSIERAAPEVASMLRRDRKLKSALALWGESLNFDERMQAQIVRPEILRSIGKIARMPVIRPNHTHDHVVHAGLEHTYGYLFSNLKTAFGYKRARWTDGSIERGLGILEAEGALLDLTTPRRTLFANATSLFGKIAFRDRPELLASLHALDWHRMTAPGIRHFSLRGRKVYTLTERAGAIALRTDIVVFQDPQAGGLLVYSVQDARGSKLVTGFPVAADFIAQVTDSARLGPNQPIKPQYNLYLPQAPTSGTRTLTEVTFP